ncbi:type IV pilus secretin PilQ family protein [Simiduia sp. 21SJ11W-1]|uniref:type IV pilus secretin PilQ n=1 Tax=Simiduia sp. 21SJ11W-1 TaxID=2909669 RepID=UPI0020A0718A|nr:type IV pilus secretin PilQ family protein [Simiduia sp. 21SJ11W-1]UTA48559.1 type IV pilus secretin PilQ family protein [Simiduia sp. 21SJ11W-1]
MKTPINMLTHVGCKLAASAALAFAAVTEAGTIQDISFAELPGQRFEVHLKFDEAPIQPDGYTIDKPARIVLDFPETDSALAQKKYALSFENAQDAAVVSAGGRTRLILSLDDLAPYNTRLDGNTFVLEVGGSNVSDYLAKSSTTKTSALAAQTNSAKAKAASNNNSRVQVADVDFKRNAQGAGELMFTLSDPHLEVDVDETSGGVRVTFINTFLEQDLRRRLDVTDFATPVTQVNMDFDGRNTVVDVAAPGQFDYIAYQADSSYVISLKPLTKKELEEKNARFAFVGDKLSLNFQDIEVRSVLQLIADFTELNLVASDTVSGRITLRLDNVPWDQALDLVLKTKGLDKRQIGNVLMVAPAAEIAERERQELETKRQLEELAPLRTEYIRVRYANAKELFELFKGKRDSGSGRDFRGGSSGADDRNSTGSLLSERGRAIVDERTNSIILTDTEEKITEFKKVIAEVDIPIRQVQIEARIVIANTNFREEMGIRWGGVALHGTDNGMIGGVTGNQRQLDSNNLEYGWETADRNKPVLNQIELSNANLVDLGVDNPAGMFTAFLNSKSSFLSLELSALEDSGIAEVVSQPKVVTGDKQKATIMSGTEIPYQEASASGATTTSFKEAVLKLDVTPQITPDNRIIMQLLVSKDSVGQVTNGVPAIDVTQLETKVLASDGETVVLGGIFETEQVNGVSKVPFFGDIPYIGRAFRKNISREDKTELLIFITPRIMADNVTQ